MELRRGWFMLLAAVVLLANPAANAATLYSNGLNNLSGNEVSRIGESDDFSIASGGTITGVEFFIGIGVTPSTPGSWNGLLQYAILSNSATNSPGTVLASGAGANIVATDTAVDWPFSPGNPKSKIKSVTFDLANPFVATAGTTYWLALHLGSDYSNTDVYWVTAAQTGNSHQISDDLNSTFPNGTELAFNLQGIAPVPLPAAVWFLGAGLLGIARLGRRRS